MSHDGSLLQAAVVFLFAAVITVPLAKRLQLGAVLGYLLAGVLIGPSVLGLVNDPQSVAHVSELGVVLLLFIIGLELSPRRLWVMRRSVFGAGLAQVLLTALAIGLVAWLVFAKSLNTAAVLGFGLALSSTAFGLQILAERKELTSPHGRLAFAILLFQDIAAIPLIALLPLLSGTGQFETEGVDLHDVLLAVASIGAVIIGGRYLLRPIFRTVLKAGLKEVSTATSLLVVVGTAWLMELAGVSMALGAFIAGLLLADSEYRHELEAQIEPFKGLLLGLFFMSVGMSADLSLLLNEPFAVMVLTVLLLMAKLPLLYLVGRFAGGLERANALRLGIVLAAGGEFAFVVFKVAFEQGMLDARLHGLLVLSITLSMAVTPLLVLGLFRRLVVAPAPVEVPDEYQHIESDAPRVVVAGMGRMGQIIARVLRAQQVPFVALDTAVDMIEYGRSLGRMPIYYGDPLRAEILRAAKVDKAEFLIIATDDPDTNLKITELVKRLYPHVKVIARARNRQHVHRLLDLGAVPVRETFHSALEMSRQALLGLGLDEERASARIRRFQRHDEEVLTAQHNVYDDDAAVVQTAREARTELEHLFDADLIEDKAVK
ncbi:glutathione-regulated potassium-efflux system protein KefB [Pseudomonas taiwanensis]|uniref:monovalent cation:proton antiporter-2 (CPA2) family protein n=1 Tax=Pseudomonas taiwanensis TaxID=470150 RepID=UPI0015B86DF1|nr:monovalent cation:proton antiporter-2 (CPA2) family protein [Pseudomonas taiwanensis]NWL77227.1 glutathione-regulated potassium-efflux system protein KefB [Pseudomonas taiwanensis]